MVFEESSPSLKDDKFFRKHPVFIGAKLDGHLASLGDQGQFPTGSIYKVMSL